MSASKRTAGAVAAALLLPLAIGAGPARADDPVRPGGAAKTPAKTAEEKRKAEEEKRKAAQPKPPANMSSVGGALLGLPGTQVKLGTGAPVLPKELSARSWIVADAESGAVLASHNAHWRLAPASTLKMLFADTLLPKFPDKGRTHLVTGQDLAGIGEGSSLVGIKEKQSYTVRDLWLGVFLRSGNDAVHVLTQMNQGLAKTVGEMNAHAAELQALDTSVKSPDGYDAPGQVSSAYDLTLIARSGMQKPDFREYAATVRTAFPGEAKPGKKRETFEIQNTNRLLTGDFGIAPYPGIAGVKNGNTTHAGATFTGVAERNGRVLLVTVMNPSSEEQHAVYKEAARLLDWGFAASGKVTPVGELVPPRNARPGTGASPSAGTDAGAAAGAADGGASPAPGKEHPATGGPAVPVAAEKGAGGVGVALGVVGGVLALLAAGVYLVNRRWPAAGGAVLRRRPRTAGPGPEPARDPGVKSGQGPDRDPGVGP